jgi:hypothetical protein
MRTRIEQKGPAGAAGGRPSSGVSPFRHTRPIDRAKGPERISDAERRRIENIGE